MHDAAVNHSSIDPFRNRVRTYACVCVCVCVLNHVQLFVIPCSSPGPSIHEILQAKILEWVAISYPGDIPDPGTEPTSFVSPALAGRFFTTSAP